MKKFTQGQKLSSRSICDSECIFTGTVVKRTAKTATIKTSMSGEKRCKIHIDTDGNEFVYPHGQYSMAPVFRA